MFFFSGPKNGNFGEIFPQTTLKTTKDLDFLVVFLVYVLGPKVAILGRFPPPQTTLETTLMMWGLWISLGILQFGPQTPSDLLRCPLTIPLPVSLGLRLT